MLLSGCQREVTVKHPAAESNRLHGKNSVPYNHSVDLDHGIVRASGVGLPPRGENNATQANALARRAAITDGQRNLAQQLMTLERQAGLTRSSDSGAIVKDYNIIEEKSLPDGECRVVLEMRLDNILLERLRNSGR